MSNLDELFCHVDNWTQEFEPQSVDWQFITEDARIRLKRLYPQIKD